MRSCNSSAYPLIWAATAALLALQLPVPAMAAGETPVDISTKPALATPPAVAASVPAVTPATVPADAATKPADATAPASQAAAEIVEKPKPLPPTLIARINLTTQTMVVQAGNKTMYSWKVSSGAPGYATPPGTFKPGWVAKMWYSKQYDDAPMPHSVFFNGGIAVHATASVHNLGRAASHGCVRLSPSNAAQFYKMVNSHGLSRTRIIVHGQQPFSAQSERIAKLRKSQPAPRAVAANQWYVVSSNGNNPYGSANYSGQRGDRYAYNAGAQQRRTAAVKPQQTYWGGF